MSQSSHVEPIEFQNDKLHVVAVHKPACRVELKVRAFSPLIETARHEAVKAVNKQVVLPGFRKGRAPDEMIAKKFPKDVEKETHNTLADVAFAEADKLVKIPFLNNHRKVTFDLQKLDEKGAEIIFSFETEPEVPAVDPKHFYPKEANRPEITDKEIDEAIRQTQFFFATWTNITDRPVRENDYLIIDLDTLEGEKTNRVFNSVRFEVSKERMAEWMQKLVIGANVGDVLEGISEPDAHATEEEKKEFAPKKVRIKILKMEEASLPPIDEEFAKKLGAKDIEGMRQLVANMLNRQLDEKIDDSLREQVNQFLIENYLFELPESLIKTEKEHRMHQLMQNAEFKKDWEKMSREDLATFEKKLLSESSDAVRLFYISRQIVRNADIGITHSEVQNEAVKTLRSYGMQQQIHVDQIPKEIYALALSKVILAHAQNHILRAQKEA